MGARNLPQRIAGGETTVHDVRKIGAIIFAYLVAGCLIGGGIVFLLLS